MRMISLPDISRIYDGISDVNFYFLFVYLDNINAQKNFELVCDYMKKHCDLKKKIFIFGVLKEEFSLKNISKENIQKICDLMLFNYMYYEISMANREEAENEEYEKLKNSKFKQQKLPGWRPVPTITSTTIIFFCFGAVFIVLGIIILVFSNKIEEVSYRYDNDEKCKNQPQCTITLNIKNKMERNIMIYYQLNGFYQNHRRYVKSKSDEQLNGKVFSVEEMRNSQDCDPAVTNAEMNKTKSCDPSVNLDPKEIAIPCGLIAKSYFNDKFTNWKINGESFSPDEKDIAWKADKELKYKNIDLKKQWIDMTDEHFIVWMRPAGLPNFRKLWGRIKDRDLEENSKVEVTIENNFDVSAFNGKKFLILSTVNAFGGKNSFLGISYIVLGGISIILAVVFIIGYNLHSKKNK